ncbi:MAG: glycosyltransferase family 4 protein [Myxococcota bacterium]
MNIVVFSKEFPPEIGGLETYSRMTAEFLARRGHAVTAFARAMPGDRAFDETCGFEVVRYPEASGISTLYRRRLGRRLRGLVGERRADVVFLPFWSRFSSVVTQLHLRHGTVYVPAIHGEEVIFPAWEPSRKQRRVVEGLKRSQRTIASCHETERRLLALGVLPERIRVIHPGVDPKQFPHDPELVSRLRERHGLAGKRVLLTAAHLRAKKGQDYVIRALAGLGEELSDLHYVLVGGGGSGESLQALAHELGLGERVALAGEVSAEELAAYYHLCDAFIMTTRAVDDRQKTEGFGQVYVEAAACGKPSIGADVGGVPDAVLDGETGLLVDSSDPESIAAGIRTLFTDDALRQRLGRCAGRRAHGELRWDRVIAKVETVLQEAVEEARCRS